MKVDTLDYKMRIFDYSYVRGKNNSVKHYRQSVLFIDSKKLGLPAFSMEPERLWHRMTIWLGIQDDINFDQNPKFSKNYRLSGKEEDLIRYYFDDDVLSFFSVNKNWYLEGINYHLVMYSLRERFHPNVIKTFKGTGTKLHDLFKTHPNALDLDQPL